MFYVNKDEGLRLRFEYSDINVAWRAHCCRCDYVSCLLTLEPWGNDIAVAMMVRDVRNGFHHRCAPKLDGVAVACAPLRVVCSECLELATACVCLMPYDAPSAAWDTPEARAAYVAEPSRRPDWRIGDPSALEAAQALGRSIGRSGSF